jgi:hypothetical protein
MSNNLRARACHVFENTPINSAWANDGSKYLQVFIIKGLRLGIGMQNLILNCQSSIELMCEGSCQEAGGVGAEVTGLETSKAERDDRRMLRALSLKSLGDMDDSGRGHGVANILEPAVPVQWLKLRAAMRGAASIAAPCGLINRASDDMRALDACSDVQYLDGTFAIYQSS